MKSLSDVSNNSHFTLLKGEPGMRKSTQALTYPLDQYWFSFDRKMGALIIPMRRWGIDPSKIKFDDYSSWDPARKLLENFVMMCPYKTVVVDSITTLADAALRQVRTGKTGTNKDGSDRGKTISGILVDGLDEFNAESAILSELIALLKMIKDNHGTNIVIIAHVIRTEQRDPSGKSNISRVLVTAGKKPAAKIPAVCDEIYHFDMENSPIVGEKGKYIIYTQGNSEDYARTTLPLGGVIDIGDKQLYADFVKPAIESQRNQK